MTTVDECSTTYANQYEAILSNGPKKVAMTTSLDVEAIRDAYEDVRADHTDTQWVVFKYENQQIACTSKGVDFQEFRNCFEENERAFGYIRLETGDEMSRRQKFVFITWIGPQVGVIHRAKMSTDKSLMKAVIKNFAVEIQLESQSEFVMDNFMETLNRAGGANYGTGIRDL